LRVFDHGYRRSVSLPHQSCDTFANLNTKALDEMSDAAAHATLTFAQTTSAIEGTDKGKAVGHGSFQGSALRR
jgi:hypothetical protein